MLILVSFMFGALLIIAAGRASDLLFYVPATCSGLLIVWAVGKRQGGRDQADEDAQPRQNTHWRR